MRQWVAAVIVVWLAACGTDPTPEVNFSPLRPTAEIVEQQPETVEEQPAPAPNTAFEDVRFYVEPGFVRSVDYRPLPATETLPSTLEFEFNGYPIGIPRLTIYPVADFEAISPGVFAPLRAVLDGSADAASLSIPDPGGTSTFAAQQQQITFPVGEGIRYVTQIDDGPLADMGLVYVFQGLTTDGTSYILGIFPVSHPESGTQTEGQPPESFTPNLRVLDDTVGSLVIASP
ncbi:MAG: hypothetical protein GYB64_18745 [Chloroflexi bacterium]|nr:hypothetical protein [Chloroflexota bacterium]